VVGDVDGNTSRIVAAANEARDRYRADVVMLPELAVSGYPPEDLLFHSGMRLQVAKSLERLKQEVRGITLVAGYPEYAETKIFNSAIVIRENAGGAAQPAARCRNFRRGSVMTFVSTFGLSSRRSCNDDYRKRHSNRVPPLAPASGKTSVAGSHEGNAR